MPSDAILNGYNSTYNCTCAYCQDACQPPNVNGDVGFFDGCDGELVAIIWCLLILVSVILYVFREYMERKALE